MLIQAKDLYKDTVLPHRESTFKKAGLTLDVDADHILDHTPLEPSVPEWPHQSSKTTRPCAASLEAPPEEAGFSSPDLETSDNESTTSSSSKV